MVSVGAIERDVLAGCQVRVPVVFVARGAEPGSAKCAFGHYLLPPRRLAIFIGNTGYQDKIPAAREVQPHFRCVSSLPRRRRRSGHERKRGYAATLGCHWPRSARMSRSSTTSSVITPSA